MAIEHFRHLLSKGNIFNYVFKYLTVLFVNPIPTCWCFVITREGNDVTVTFISLRITRIRGVLITTLSNI